MDKMEMDRESDKEPMDIMEEEMNKNQVKFLKTVNYIHFDASESILEGKVVEAEVFKR